MRLLLLAIASFFVLSSCTSEYEERMAEAKQLKSKLALIEETNFLAPSDALNQEIETLNERIDFLAKLSGNESLFKAQLLGD